MARYREPDINQYRIITLNFADLFPPDHVLSRLLELIRSLDLSKFDEGYRNDTENGGRKALPPDRILAVIIYSLLYGNISMRNLEWDSKRRADLMYLLGGLDIDHTTLSVFRKRHGQAIEDLFQKVVFLGIESAYIDLETVCIDSTKIKASANRRDIGSREELQNRLQRVTEACQKRYEQWSRFENDEANHNQIKKLERQKEKLVTAIDFLNSHEERKRVHLNEPDADWQHLRSDSFIVGYSAQVAADSKTKMIVYKEVVARQPDCEFAVPMIEAVEKIKAEMMPEKKDEIHYALDSGYASEENYRKLQDRDIYMPDKESAAENRKKKGRKLDKVKFLSPDQYPSHMRFIYNQADDTFHCDGGHILKVSRERNRNGYLTVEYRTNKCTNCIYRGCCAGWDDRREIEIVKSKKGIVTVKELPVKFKEFDLEKVKAATLTYTKEMREKLKTEAAKAIYGLRFTVSEGVFGIMKSARRGEQFLRRGINRVGQEFTERCIAHNIACLLSFRRAD